MAIEFGALVGLLWAKKGTVAAVATSGVLGGVAIITIQQMVERRHRLFALKRKQQRYADKPVPESIRHEWQNNIALSKDALNSKLDAYIVKAKANGQSVDHILFYHEEIKSLISKDYQQVYSLQIALINYVIAIQIVSMSQ